MTFQFDESFTLTDREISEIKQELDVSDSLNYLISLGLIVMRIDEDGNQVFDIVDKHREFLRSIIQ